MPALTEGTSTLLIVDDHDDVRQGLAWALQGEFRIVQASNLEEALAKLVQEKVDVVLCDLHLTSSETKVEGLDVIAAARNQRPPVPVIVITGSRSRRAGLEAINHGAYGYFEKPVKGEEAAHIVRQAARVRCMEQELLQLREEHGAAFGFGLLVGNSAALSRAVAEAKRVAGTSATALITGESGTGKELLARALHYAGPRVDGPFIAVNCGALPETLVEAELFGAEKGSYTNSVMMRKGRFELADGGTLFLDEVGELEQNTQVKLLRALEERSFERIGSSKTIKVDIRLIAASNRDLEKAVKDGTFREDLYYRLNVIQLRMPPLRDRREDIPLLAAHFAERAAKAYDRPFPQLSPVLVQTLQQYDWPGNVRELKNAMERLVVLSTSAELGLEFLPPNLESVVPLPAVRTDDETLEQAMHKCRIDKITQALKAERGHRTAAARRLDISRSYLHRLITELGLDDVASKADE
jgi:DNA-binding NtrC family response regulator